MSLLAFCLICSVSLVDVTPEDRQARGGTFSGRWTAKDGVTLSVLNRLLPTTEFGYSNGSSEKVSLAEKSRTSTHEHPGHVQLHLIPSKDNDQDLRGSAYLITGSKQREYSLRGVLSEQSDRMAVMLVPKPLQGVVVNKYVNESRIAHSFVAASYSVEYFSRNQSMWLSVINETTSLNEPYPMPNSSAVRLTPPKGRKGERIWGQTQAAIEADGCIWYGDLLVKNVTKRVPNRYSKTEVFHSIGGSLISLTCNTTFELEASQETVVKQSDSASTYLLIGGLVTMLQTWGMAQQVTYARTRSAQTRVSWITFLNIGTYEWALASYHWGILELMPALVRVVMAISVFHLVTFHFCARHAYDSLESQGVHNRVWLLPTLSFPINLLWRLTEDRLIVGPVSLWVPSLFLVHSLWVPQIIHSAEHKAARPVTVSVLVTTLVSRCYFCYFRIIDQSITTPFHSEPGVYAAVLFWIFFQTAVVFAQQTLGPTFFIPQGMVSPAYDYHAPLPSQYRVVQPEDRPRGTAHKRGSSINATVDLEAGLGNQSMNTPTTPVPLDCVICQTGIDPAASSGYMLAPCEHIFHTQCLQQWMQQKMECPVCRRSLPECQMEPTGWSVF